VSASVPSGRYYLTVAAQNEVGVGPSSAEISVVVGAAAPSVPRGVNGSAQGSSVTVTWQAPESGGPISNYILRAGTAPGVPNLFNGAVGPVMSVSASLPAGTYFISVAAQGAGGIGPASPEISISVSNTCSPPSPPTDLRAEVTASFVRLLWTPPAAGTPTYIVEVGTATGLSNVGRFNHGWTPSVVFPTPPSGTYFVRVRSRSDCGESSPSNEAAVTIGAALPNVSGTWTLTRAGSTAYPWIQTYSTFIVTLVQNGSQLSGSIRPTLLGAPSTPILFGSVSASGVVLFGSESAYWNDAPGRIGSDGYFRLTLDGTGRAMSGPCTTTDTCTTASATRN